MCVCVCVYVHTHTHGVIHKSLRDFRPLRYSSRDDHAEGEHVNRGRDTPSFCPTLQVLDMSNLGVCLGCCAAEFVSSGGTYELPCVCVYIYIYIYIYTHTHTHTHTCIARQPASGPGPAIVRLSDIPIPC